MRFTPLGDRAVTITLGNTIDLATHRRVRSACAALEAHPPAGMTDQVPAFASVTVHYDPALVAGDTRTSAYDRLVAQLDELLSRARDEKLPAPRLVEIPVCYGGTLGPDLDDVAKRHELTPAQVVEMHAAAEYLVYMVGFMPGFAYMGGLPERLATPRRSTPRTAVPAGTVGIGGSQTGVYPLESPGGWNLIGRTPTKIFDIRREPATLLATGDHARFVPISLEEFDRWPSGER
jgi:inhibitor of KinA